MADRMTHKGAILKYLRGLGKRNGHVNPDSKDNMGQYLGEIFMWSVAKKFVDDEYKKAWETVETVGLVPDKDKLRQSPDTEKQLFESPSYACNAKVSKPMRRFKKDVFIGRLAKKYKLDAAELKMLADSCMEEGNPSVSLSVVERT